MSDYQYYSPILNQIDSSSQQIKMNSMFNNVQMQDSVSAKPLFNYQFDINTAFDNMWANMGASKINGSGDSSSNGNYLSDLEKRIKESQEREIKKQEEKRAKEERQSQIDELRRVQETNEQTKKSISENKRADGTVSVYPQAQLEEKKVKDKDGNEKIKYSVKKKSFPEGFARGASNVFTAGKNLVAGIIGYDENGDWSFGRFARNAAIIGFAATLTVATGGTGGPVGVAMLYSGLAMGTYGAVKSGIDRYNAGERSEKAEQKLANAMNSENSDAIAAAQKEYEAAQKEIDNSEQRIATNAFIAITSAMGLRNVGAASRAAATTTGTTATSGNAAVRAWSSVKTATADIFKNPLKSAYNIAKSDIATIRANGGFVSGSVKLAGSRLKSAATGFWHSTTNQYNKRYAEIETKLNNRLADIQNEINGTTDTARLAELNEEKLILESNLKELQSIGNTLKTKEEIEALRSTNSGKTNARHLRKGESLQTANSNTGASGTQSGNANSAFNPFNPQGTPATPNGTMTGASAGSGTSSTQSFRREWVHDMIKNQKAYSKQISKLSLDYKRMMRTKAGWGIWRGFKAMDSRVYDYVPEADNMSTLRAIIRRCNIFKTNFPTMNKYQASIGSMNWDCRPLFGSMVTPASNIAKGIGTYDWMGCEPLHSGAFGFAMDLTAEQAKKQEKFLDSTIKIRNEIINKMESAKTDEEYANAINMENALQSLELEYQQNGSYQEITMEDIERCVEEMKNREYLESQKQQAEAQQAAAKLQTPAQEQ